MTVEARGHRIAMTQDFQHALLALDARQLVDVQRALLKIQAGHNATHLHKLEGCDRLWSFGVNRDAVRIICSRDEGEVLLLLHVAAHDDAYAWAKRHRIVHVGQVVRVVPTEVGEAQPARDVAPQYHTPGPLHDVSDRDFARLGVPPRMATFLRELPTSWALEELLEVFSTPLAMALIELQHDPARIDRALLTMERAEREQVEPARGLAEVLAEDINRHLFWMAPDDQRMLEAMLSGDVEAWRVYLHPSQRRVVRVDSGGAYKVTGGPGTGKTVVALHRARHLAEEVFTGEDARPILLCSYSRVLTMELERGMRKLCEDAPALMERFEFRTITNLAQHVLREAGEPASLIIRDELDDCWREAMVEDTAGYTRHFYEAERAQHLAREGVWTLTSYMRTPRRGRRGHVRRSVRKQLWPVFEALEQAMARRGGGDGVRLAREATRCVNEGAFTSPWAAIVCDELQDIDAGSLRLLAALVRDRTSGELRPNSLFLVGDNYQSLYQRPIALSRCGVAVRGRSAVLRRNYRTTEGIRRAAIEVVADVSFDETEVDEAPTLDGYVSTRDGAPPERVRFDTPADEADFVAEVAAQREDEQLLVLARTNQWLDRLRGLLHARSVRARKLGNQDTPEADDHVLLCTMHRAKGLEAPRVIVAGAQLWPMACPTRGDEGAEQLWERQERCLLYVAITRARDWCAISRVGGAP